MTILATAKRLGWGLTVVVCMGLAANDAWGLGEEDFGNAKVSPGNYKDWPGVAPMLDDQHRVYHNWVNGNESFYFDGDIGAINVALAKFARVEDKAKRIVLLGGGGECRSFHGKVMRCTWRLHLVGGIAKAVAERNNKPPIYDLSPTFYVYAKQGMDLSKLKLPASVDVEGIGDMRTRYYAGIKKGDQQVAGYAAYFLSDVDPFSKASAAKIAGILDKQDIDSWSVQMACTSLKRFGAVAKPHVEKLKMLESPDARAKKSLDETIQAVQSAKPAVQRAKQVADTDAKIAKLIAKRRTD